MEEKEIKLDSSKADTAIATFNEAVEQLKSMYQKLVDTNEFLKESWQGNSKNVFSDCAEIMEHNLMGRIQECERLIKNVDNAKEAFVELDETIYRA